MFINSPWPMYWVSISHIIKKKKHVLGTLMSKKIEEILKMMQTFQKICWDYFTEKFGKFSKKFEIFLSHLATQRQQNCGRYINKPQNCRWHANDKSQNCNRHEWTTKYRTATGIPTTNHGTAPRMSFILFQTNSRKVKQQVRLLQQELEVRKAIPENQRTILEEWPAKWKEDQWH